ncbi:hypothetical protein FRC07_014559, partial [Ceratobasidium sp. 392]
MSDLPAAQSAEPQAASDSPKGKEGGTGRSRVYIACTLWCTVARGKSSVEGNSRPAEIAVVLILNVIMIWNPNAGPDKKPGTRVRTRKDSTGTVLPPKPRIHRTSQAPASSIEPPL